MLAENPPPGGTGRGWALDERDDASGEGACGSLRQSGIARRQRGTEDPSGRSRGATARGDRRTRSEDRSSNDGSQSRHLSSRKSPISGDSEVERAQRERPRGGAVTAGSRGAQRVAAAESAGASEVLYIPFAPYSVLSRQYLLTGGVQIILRVIRSSTEAPSRSPGYARCAPRFAAVLASPTLASGRPLRNSRPTSADRLPSLI